MVKNSSYFCGETCVFPISGVRDTKEVSVWLLQQPPLTLRDQSSPLVDVAPVAPKPLFLYETGTLPLRGRLHPAADSYLPCLGFLFLQESHGQPSCLQTEWACAWADAVAPEALSVTTLVTVPQPGRVKGHKGCHLLTWVGGGSQGSWVGGTRRWGEKEQGIREGREVKYDRGGETLLWVKENQKVQ